MITQETKEQLVEEFRTVSVGSWAQEYTFEAEQGDDLVVVTATVDPYYCLPAFSVIIVDQYGNSRESNLKDYQHLFYEMCNILDQMKDDEWIWEDI